jgi:hypothetical protein
MGLFAHFMDLLILAVQRVCSWRLGYASRT